MAAWKRLIAPLSHGKRFDSNAIAIRTAASLSKFPSWCKKIPSGQRINSTNFHPQPMNLGAVRLFSSTPKKIFKDAADFLILEGVDHIEIYCSNAKQAAHFYCSAFGFQPEAYSGLETGNKEKTSYVVKQGKIRLVLTSTFMTEGEIAEHVKVHGDGVHAVSLRVPDAAAAFEETTKRGAIPYLNPTTINDENGEFSMSGVRTYGDTVHYFIERKNYTGPFMPGFMTNTKSYPGSVGLKHIDHTVANVGWEQMNQWGQFYKTIFGMSDLISFDDKDISTDYTALMSKVVTNGTGYVKFPINEPAKGLKRSQIEEYLNFYNGPGVQHVALATDDIIKTVSAMTERGCEFLTIPPSYYEMLSERCGEIDESIEDLKKYSILVDHDEHGYMLQIFTRPVADRPTLFFEIIQRKGALSFGRGNFKALFESIEEEQRRRNTLE